MRKDRYVFPAIFSYDEDGIAIEFPDLPGCLTCGDTDEEALYMAKEAMALHLYAMEREDDTIPMSSSPLELKLDQNQVIVLIEAWMPSFRSKMRKQSVKKTLTIPKWLDDIAKEHQVNYSHILQEALKEHLGLSDH